MSTDEAPEEMYFDVFDEEFRSAVLGLFSEKIREAYRVAAIAPISSPREHGPKWIVKLERVPRNLPRTPYRRGGPNVSRAPEISQSAADLQVGDEAVVLNFRENVSYPAGGFAAVVTQADERSVAVGAPGMEWWFHRSSGHSYTGHAFIGRAVRGEAP